MRKKRQKKSSVWVYAVVLFTSAFIVLFVTAYSQDKVYKNYDSIKDRLSQTENLKAGFEKDFLTSQQQIKSLNDKVESQGREVEILKQKLTLSQSESDNNAKMLEIYTRKVDQLMKARALYDAGNFVECSLQLQQFDMQSTSASLIDQYNYLKSSATQKGVEQAYKQGMQCYWKAKYADAILNFENSLKLSQTENYSDDCLYYLAQCQYKSGNIAEAKNQLNKLITDYPNSSFFKNASYYLKKWE